MSVWSRSDHQRALTCGEAGCVTEAGVECLWCFPGLVMLFPSNRITGDRSSWSGGQGMQPAAAFFPTLPGLIGGRGGARGPVVPGSFLSLSVQLPCLRSSRRGLRCPCFCILFRLTHGLLFLSLTFFTKCEKPHPKPSASSPASPPRVACGALPEGSLGSRELVSTREAGPWPQRAGCTAGTRRPALRARSRPSLPGLRGRGVLSRRGEGTLTLFVFKPSWFS